MNEELTPEEIQAQEDAKIAAEKAQADLEQSINDGSFKNGFEQIAFDEAGNPMFGDLPLNPPSEEDDKTATDGTKEDEVDNDAPASQKPAEDVDNASKTDESTKPTTTAKVTPKKTTSTKAKTTTAKATTSK